jgi:hypothetical protein
MLSSTTLLAFAKFVSGHSDRALAASGSSARDRAHVVDVWRRALPTVVSKRLGSSLAHRP